MELRKTSQHSVNFVEYGCVHNAFVKGKDTILEQERAILPDIKFVLNAMTSF